jgi:hypothetical protein
MLLKEILDGWGNWARLQFKSLDIEIVNLSKSRLLKCNVCEIRTGHICNPNKKGKDAITNEIKKGCGCAIPPKT